MTSTHAFRRFAFAYATAYALFYAVALAQDLALFTVYPSLGIVLLGTHHSKDVAGPAIGFAAPTIHWYGWTATAAIGAFVLGLAVALLPDRWVRRSWPGWACRVAPVGAMIACVYLTLPWFRR